VTGRFALPTNVVRFYGNEDYAVETIARQQIAFVHVSKLNDPFDPYFFFETDFGVSYKKLLGWVEKNHPDALSWFRRHVTADSLGQAVKDVRQGMEQLRDTSFIFSCSAVTKDFHPKNNLYMWGHYGNGHRGVALEFDARKVASVFRKPTGETFAPESVWIRIEYEAKFAPITCAMFFDFFRNEYEGSGGLTSLETYYDRLTRVKSIVWQKEEEWRLFYQPRDKTRLKVHRELVPPESLTAVYIGLQASRGSEADIVFETRKHFPSAKIFRAHKKPGFTELKFRQIPDQGPSAASRLAVNP
jgi:hypothetical protein